MNDWIEIFKVGTHKDSKGRERTWTTNDLDKMIARYNPADHEAPAVIGHPKDNHPAYGWVAGLKRVGDQLMARFKQVVPEFASMVERGMFKKRSIRVNADGTLGHVGFLGAVPPAVKGLKDIEFKASEECFEYEESTKDPEFMADIRLAEEISAYVCRDQEFKATEERFDYQNTTQDSDFAADIRLAEEIAAYVTR